MNSKIPKLTGQVVKDNDLLKMLKARGIEFGAGAALGGSTGAGIGYAKSKDDKEKKKQAIKGAIIGALAGGTGAVGLNKLMSEISNTVANKINLDHKKLDNEAKEIIKKFESIKDDISIEEKELYDYLHKSRKSMKHYIDLAKANKGDKEALNMIKKSLKDMLRSKKNVVENHKHRIAKIMANKKAKEKFINELAEGKKINLSSYKNKAFGGFKSNYETLKELDKLKEREIYINQIANNLNSDLLGQFDLLGKFDLLGNKDYKLSRMHFNIYKGLETNLHDIMKSKEFKEKIRKIKRQAYQDAKKGIKSESLLFDKAKLDKASKVLGIDLNNIKSKSELNKIYRNLAKKYHPDLNPGPEARAKMSEINKVMNDIKKSDWFNKLASFDAEQLEKIAMYKKIILEEII